MQATTTSSRSASASSCGSIAQASDASDRRIESFEQGQLPRTRQAFNDSRAVIESFAAEIADGSKSFALASRLLPADVRAGALVFYAYCRRADDAIDESDNPQRALCELKAQLDRIFGEARQSDKLELALQHLVGHYQIPRAPFDWLLEGFSWDAGEKVYATQEDLVGYAVRVAGTIGLVMAMMMGRHDEYALARATDLGIGMQLTNIARDVGADARLGRVYLPENWLNDAALSRDAILRGKAEKNMLAPVIKRLLAHAELFYERSRAGVSLLPNSCQLSILSASSIYREIGRVIESNGYEVMAMRAHTSKFKKLRLIARSWLDARVLRRPNAQSGELQHLLAQPPAKEAKALVQACLAHARSLDSRSSFAHAGDNQ